MLLLQAWRIHWRPSVQLICLACEGLCKLVEKESDLSSRGVCSILQSSLCRLVLAELYSICHAVNT